MKVEIFYFAGCPNHVPTAERVRALLEQEGVRAEVEEIEVRTPEQAEALGFLGSPSVRVDGVDVEPEARGVKTFGFGCRTYVEEGRRVGVPSAAMVQDAIRQGALRA